MKPYNGYKKGTPTQEKEKLPVGGYVIKIMDAEEVTYQWGSALKISFDILEGEYKDFYARDYRGQQEPKKWKGVRQITVPADKDEDKNKDYFANQIACIEASNPGYEFDFDEKKLKGKVVGAVFGEKEYEFNGNRGFFTTCRGFRTVDAIRAGKFKTPAPLMLKTAAGGSSDGFFPIAESVSDEDLPF
jgi:hypothetical protein